MLFTKSIKYIILLYCISITIAGISQKEYHKITKSDSLINLLSAKTSDSSKCIILYDLINELDSIGKKKYYNERLKSIIDKNIKENNHTNSFYRIQSINYYINAGYIEYKSGNIQKAKNHYHKAILIAEKSNNKKALAHALSSLGWIYQLNAEYPEALKLYFKSLKISESINNKDELASTLSNISTVYFQQKDTTETFKYLRAALKINIEAKNLAQTAFVLHNLGALYLNFNDYPKALSYLKQSSEIRIKINDRKNLAATLSYIGAAYARQNLLSEGLKYMEQSLTILESFNDKISESDCLNAMALSLFEAGEINNSYRYAKKGLVVSLNINYFQGIINHSEILYNIYKEQKKYKNALEMHELCYELSDSISNANNYKETIKQQLNYERDKKQKELDLLKKEKELKAYKYEVEITKQQTQKNYLIGGIIISILIIIIVSYTYKQRIKTNNIIAVKNQEIKTQQANLDGQLQERQRVAKDLHDSVGGTLAAIKLSILNYKQTKFNDVNVSDIISQIDNACSEVRTISHNLSSVTITNNLSYVDTIKKLITQFETPEKLMINIDCFPEEQINSISTIIKETLYKILQESLNNIIKHANASRVDINISVHSNNLVTLIEDNGIGFDATIIDNGIGLSNMRKRITELNGEIHFDSKKGRGTAINITIPYS